MKDIMKTENRSAFHILIIEDDEDLAQSLKIILESHGYKTALANGEASALKAFENLHFQMALVDIKLGDGNGLKLIPKLKKIEPALLCVIITAYATRQHFLEAMEEGAFDFLRKPFDPLELINTTNQCFEIIRLAHQKAVAESAFWKKIDQINAHYRQPSLGIANWTINGKWLKSNKAFCEILDYAPEKMRGKSFFEVIHPDDRSGVRECFDNLARGKAEILTKELRLIRRDGSYAYIQMMTSLIRNPSGLPDYLITIIEEIDFGRN
jgi:PAS domain S-box-containing protein